MSDAGAPIYEATVRVTNFPPEFVSQATSSPSDPVNVYFTLYIEGQPMTANTFLSELQGAGYGNACSCWKDFLEKFLNLTSISEYVLYALTWSNSIMAQQIITTDRVNEVLSLALDQGSTSVSFTGGTRFKFPTFVSIPAISNDKFLVTYIFTVYSPTLGPTGGPLPVRRIERSTLYKI